MIFNWFKKTTASLEGMPDFWLEYLACFENAYERSTPIEKIRFVCFDTETTGLDPRNDQLLSIGAVAIQNWEIIVEDRFECMVHQEYEPINHTIAIHGILPKYREYSLSEKEAICSFLTYIRHSVLVGHQLNFDLSIVNEALLGIIGKKETLVNAQLDTINLARRLLPAYHPLAAGSLSLDQLAKRYHIPAYDRHTASGDAFMTAILFLKILARHKKRGNKTLGDLLRK